MSEVDLAAIEENIKAAVDGSPEQGEAGDLPKEGKVLADGEKGKVDIDKLLDNDGFEPISLEGKITDEEAIDKATERGWRADGKDKFGHSISAIEFLERAPMFHKMDLMRGDIKKQQKQMDELVTNSKLIAEQSIKDKERLGKELKTARDALLSTELLDKDDIKELNKIDEQIAANNETVVAEKAPEDNAEFKAYQDAKVVFEETNKEWYGKDRAMTALADSLGEEYVKSRHAKNGILPDPSDLFRYVMDEMKDELPEIEKRQTRVASRKNRTVASKPVSKQTLADLPEDQQAIAREVIASIPDMTEEKYLKSYAQ